MVDSAEDLEGSADLVVEDSEDSADLEEDTAGEDTGKGKGKGAYSWHLQPRNKIGSL